VNAQVDTRHALSRLVRRVLKICLLCAASTFIGASAFAQEPVLDSAHPQHQSVTPAPAAPTAMEDSMLMPAGGDRPDEEPEPFPDSTEPMDGDMEMGPQREGETPAEAAPSAEMDMESMDEGSTPDTAEAPSEMDMGSMDTASSAMESMDMESMGADRAPADARDPDAYAEGYEYTGMPGLEESDQIAFGYVLVDELEFLSGNEGDGFAWNVQANYGDDRNKLWFRTQGLKVPGELDPTSSAEVLWWRPYAPFWGTQLGVRRDVGPGARTYLAAGIEGLSPYRFKVEATGYLGDDARVSARLKVSYDILWTNRLILTPSAEANIYSKSDDARGLGAGLGNLEGGLRLRYEVQRKFAPYVGYVWERAFSGTARRRRAEGAPVNEHRFVVGVRVWF
jgi:copper resistance protein B